MRKTDVISVHPGRQHNFEQANQLSKKFAAFKHITSLFISQEKVRTVSRFSPKLGRALSKRSADIAGKFVDINPIPELSLLIKRELNKSVPPQAYLVRNKKFQEWIFRHYAPPKVCIGYDTSSWLLFEKWKGKSYLILDLSIAVPQFKRHLGKLHNLQSDRMTSLTAGDDLTYKIYEQEINQADLILCGSQFVKDSCLSEGIGEEKLLVLPYGADLNKFASGKSDLKSIDKIKIVFVGNFSYRKGGDIVLQSWRKLQEKYPNAELHIYGNVQVEHPTELPRLFLHGFIQQQELIEELKHAHISILPTFFEGSSLAIYQSMAMGLAVITTPNAGSVIENGRNGILIPYGSETALTESLENLIVNEQVRSELGKQARIDIQNYTWDDYGAKLALEIEKHLD